MGTVITNLKARFGVDSSDFKKGLKDGEKAIDEFKGAAGDKLDEFASMFGVNMGAVGKAIDTANKSLNFVVQSFKGATSGGEKFAIAMKIVKTALISTGIGALVVALGSLVAYFTKSGEGADKFAKILSQIKSVVGNVIERLAILGKGIWEIATGKFKQGWQDMTSAFKGMGEEIKEDWKAAGALAQAEDALEDREIALINSLEERRAKVAELRLQAKEETEDQNKKLSLLKQAESIIRSVYGDEVSLEQERLRIMRERIAMASKDPTDEQRRGLAEQEAKINSLLREQAEALKAIVREKKSALDIVTQEAALEEAKSKTIGITKVTLENIQMPDFSTIISKALAPLHEIQKAISGVMVDITQSVNSAFESMAVASGEFLGNLLNGDANLADFGKVVMGTLADVAIAVGKVCISSGVAMLALKSALAFDNPAGAIIAGIALVAIGQAVKGALSSAVSGAGSSGSAAAMTSSSYTFNTSTQAQTQPIEIHLTGKLIGEGKDLAAVLEQENFRKYKYT
jgi:hypothetical protein